MRTLFSTIACLFFIVKVYSQYKYDYVWLMGDPTEDPNSENGMNVFDFNADTLQIVKQQKGLGSYVTNAGICNDAGELLFYTNGCSINNASHNLMQNGAGLNLGYPYLSGNCPLYGNTVTKGAFILKKPESENSYYLFHQAKEAGNGADIYIRYLYYSIIDMSLNNGLGAVTDKNVIILNDTLYNDFQAVKHSNNKDWWLIGSKENSPLFYKILLTSNGVINTGTQNIGIKSDPWTAGSGMASFSPDGTKFARYSTKDQVTLFNFDRSTGELSNFQQLYADTTEGFWGGLSFSSNSRFLYVSTQFKLFQFDMLASDIQASKVLIDVWDGFTEFGFSTVMFFLMQLAPDCKIYMIPVNGSKYMHVIEHPNEPGLACDFRQRGLVLPAINNTSIPNFPNYRLGTGYPVCDSNIVYVSGTGSFVTPPVEEVRVWPNPAREELNLELSAPTGKPVRFRLFEATGRLAREWAMEGSGQAQSLNLHGLANGLYFWQLNTVEGQPLDRGKLVIVK